MYDLNNASDLVRQMKDANISSENRITILHEALASELDKYYSVPEEFETVLYQSVHRHVELIEEQK